MGNDGSPRHPFHLTREIITQVLSDSLPEIKKSTEESSNKDNTPVIKEVPKSRKQIKPIAVPSAPQIQPIKIIKPKIVKPTIKLRLN